MFERSASKSSNVKKYQFWQHHNKPIELRTSEVIDRYVDHIHNDPVKAGFVTELHYWQYSSAAEHSGMKGSL